MSSWTYITGLGAPSANVLALTGLTLTGYKLLQVVVAGVTVQTDGTDLKLTLYTGGSEVTSGYRWGEYHNSSAPASGNTGSTADSGIALVSTTANWDVGNDTGECFGCTIWIDQPNSTALHKRVRYEGSHIGPTGAVICQSGVGVMESTSAMDGLKISGTSNITAGSIRLLGLP